MLTQSQIYTTSLCARPGLNSVTKASGFWISVKAQASWSSEAQAERRSPERSMSSLISLLLRELGCLRPGFETPPSQPSCLTSTAPALPPSSRHAQLRRAQGKAEGCLQKTWERHQRKRSPRKSASRRRCARRQWPLMTLLPDRGCGAASRSCSSAKIASLCWHDPCWCGRGWHPAAGVWTRRAQ